MAEKIVLDVEIKTGGSQKSLSDLENEVKSLNDQLKEVPIGSEAFKDLAEDISEANQEIISANESMQTLSGDELADQFASLGGSVGEAVAGFSLLGGEGGALQETIGNIQNAIGTAMAFKGTFDSLNASRKIFNDLIKKSSLLTALNTKATKIAAVVQKLFTGSVKTTTTGFKLLRGAIIATGIGALVVAIGLLIANFDKLKEALFGVSAAQKAALEDQQKAVDLADERLNSISEQENILKLQGKSEREILNMKIFATNEAIKERKIRLDMQQKRLNAQIAAEKRNNESLKSGLHLLTIVPSLLGSVADLAIEGFNSLISQMTKIPFISDMLGGKDLTLNFSISDSIEDFNKLFENSIAEFLFDPKETSKKASETLTEAEKAIKALENQRAGFILTKNSQDKAAADEQKALEDADKKRRGEMERIKIRGNEETKLELVEQEKTFNQKMLELYGADVLAYEASLEKKKQEQLNAQNATFDLAQSGVTALLQLNEAFTGETEAQQKKAFERRKKLEIAGALIASAQGVVNILANKSAVPSPFDVPFKAAQIGILLATTVAQISKIKQQQFSGGGSVATPNIGGGSIPTIDPVTNTSTVVGQQPQQVYVTETDITNTQNQVSVIENQATIQ